MSSTGSKKYVDHPAPSVPTAILFFTSIAFAAVSIPVIVTTSEGREVGPYVAITLLTLVILAFYLWPIYTTYYTLSPEGLHVRYGPWKRLYPWSDFSAAFWQKGMFASKIGWPSVTPCVRFSNCVQLRRRKGWFPLYLTPNDPRAFLARLSEFAPELTKETIL
jgi:hypothetical protein